MVTTDGQSVQYNVYEGLGAKGVPEGEREREKERRDAYHSTKSLFERLRLRERLRPPKLPRRVRVRDRDRDRDRDRNDISPFEKGEGDC